MEQMESKPITIRRSREQIIELLKGFDKSRGIKVRDFCRQRQISEAAFYVARKRYRPKNAAGKSGFIALPSWSVKNYFGEPVALLDRSTIFIDCGDQ